NKGLCTNLLPRNPIATNDFWPANNKKLRIFGRSILLCNFRDEEYIYRGNTGIGGGSDFPVLYGGEKKGFHSGRKFHVDPGTDQQCFQADRYGRAFCRGV